MSSNDWYKDYIARINKDAENVKPVKEVDQGILHYKSVGVKAFTGYDGCETSTFNVNGEDKFFFTERMVNQLMQFAYNMGAKSIDKKSYDVGYGRARADVLSFLGAEEED